MKKVIVSTIWLLLLGQLSCSSPVDKKEDYNFLDVVECLNENVIISNEAVQSLYLIEDTLKNYSDIGTFKTLQYITKGSLNMKDFQFNIEYYYSDNLSSAIKLEDRFKELYRMELALVKTRKVSRVGNIVFRITTSRISDSQEVSLQRVFSDLYLNYINFCGGNVSGNVSN